MNVRYWVRHPFKFGRRVWYFFYERAHPKEPFLAPAAIRFLDDLLPRDGVGLEWGSGRSTQWLAPRLHTLVAVEHDAKWYEQVRHQLGESLLPKVDYRLIPLEHSPEEPTRPIYDPGAALRCFCGRVSRRAFRLYRDRRSLPTGVRSSRAKEAEVWWALVGG